MKVVDVAQMRALEAAAEKGGLPGPALMEVAGRAFADALAERYGLLPGQRVAVLVGPGNNGGDGLVAARWLAERGARPVVLTIARRAREDAKLDLLRDRGVAVAAVDDGWTKPQVVASLGGSAVVVDGLFGIGRVRPLGATIGRIFEAAAALGLPVVALDLPSGLDADTGRADAATPRCAATITLGAVKRGLIIGDGPERAGVILPLEIGIPRGAASELPVDALDEPLLRSLLPERSTVSHKYRFGRVMVVAGSARYVGAPTLTALGAARAGAGLVTLAAPEGVAAGIAGRAPEVTHLPLPGASSHLGGEALVTLVEAAARYDALVVGPGLGRDPATAELLRTLLADERLRGGPRWVIDADALTLLSQERDWWKRLPDDTVLTPHTGEMARLLGREEIGADRLAVALDSAARWSANVVLKGPYTVVAAPDGRGAVALSANPALATAGTGDVLAGVIAGLIAQGLSLCDAARAGVGLHAAAGELLKDEFGQAGGLAGDLADLLPRAGRLLRHGTDRAAGLEE